MAQTTDKPVVYKLVYEGPATHITHQGKDVKPGDSIELTEAQLRVLGTRPYGMGIHKFSFADDKNAPDPVVRNVAPPTSDVSEVITAEEAGIVSTPEEAPAKGDASKSKTKSSAKTADSGKED